MFWRRIQRYSSVNILLLNTYYVPGTVPAVRNGKYLFPEGFSVGMRVVIEKVICAVGGSRKST